MSVRADIGNDVKSNDISRNPTYLHGDGDANMVCLVHQNKGGYIMRKKALALGLCAAMTVGTLAGCSSKTATDATTAAPAGTTAAGEASTEAKTEAPASNEDLEGTLYLQSGTTT